MQKITRTRWVFFLLTTAFLLIGQYGSGQTNKKDSLLKQLRKANRVEGQFIGIVAARSTIYKTAQLLWDISSIDALTKLTSDKSPIIRCYALLGLIEKKADKKIVREIADKHKNDKTKITTMNGCIEWEHTVGIYMDLEATYYCMDPKLRRCLDSLWINN
ncbi:MAG TPA: hypothetical protein VE978_09520 [Chitinophagales bacterium]|nr:hypothetical protein [Chitinophagales bacterium]